MKIIFLAKIKYLIILEYKDKIEAINILVCKSIILTYLLHLHLHLHFSWLLRL
jgi:hypothetical protein